MNPRKMLLTVMAMVLLAASLSFGAAEVAAAQGSVNVAGEPVDERLASQSGSVSSAAIGDVDCDGQLSIADAVVLAQFSTGIRSDAPCEGLDQLSEIHLESADANFDGRVDIGDALAIAHCVVGLSTKLCPDIGRFEQQGSVGSLPAVAWLVS